MSTDRQDHDEAEALAQRFHETYERLAPHFGYETREASAKPWADVPEQNRSLMVAVCAELIGAEIGPPATPRSWVLPTIPEDVKAVRDDDGMIWYRHSDGDEPLWWNEDDDAKTTAELLAAGEVTELLPGEFETPEDDGDV